MPSTLLVSFATLLLSCIVVLLDAAPASAYSLKTRDTSIQVSAGESCPRLTQLESKHGLVWNNSATESLPDSVEVDGLRVRLHWQLSREQCIVTDRHLSFVYNSASPKLKLTWDWLARADFGPLEHSITITNE